MFEKYIGKKFITICDTRLFEEGTVITIEDISSKNGTKFKCQAEHNGKKLMCTDGKSYDIYLDAYEFLKWIDIVVIEI